MSTYTLHRVKACIKYGIKNKIDSKGVDINIQADCTDLEFPESGWEEFVKALMITDKFHFTFGEIVSYFVNRSVSDGLPADDFKAINSSAENLFRCGHIQGIQVCATEDNLFLKAKCLPEMRKDRVYFLKMVLNVNSCDIFYAECGFPAGVAPQGSCKHIGAFSYALADFCRVRCLPEYMTCTDKLREWNQPCGKRVEPIPVDQLGARRRELKPEQFRSRGSKAVFDPRPLKFRTPCPQRLEELRCNLLKLEKLPSFLNVILPSVDKIQHDHCYCIRSDEVSDIDLNGNEECDNDTAASPNQLFVIPAVAVEQNMLEKLILTAEERDSLESCTRQQSECDKWHDARRLRITGSKCGRILLQKKRTVSLLQFCMYPKVMQHLPKPIAWGINNEDKARQEYVKVMGKDGHYGIEATRAGFVVHPRKCWLGASPDAWVTDSSVTNPQGIAKFKCPYSKAFVHPREACKNADFYCSIIDGQLHPQLLSPNTTAVTCFTKI